MAGERVLFVDDEGQIRKLVQAFLQRQGYIVTTATDGYEALLAIKKQRPHLMITDVQMPNLNGLELTKRLRAEAATARLPIIMLSARKQANDILAGYAQGADEYVAKPVELAVLAAKVELILKRMKIADDADPAAAPRAPGRVCLFLHGKGGVGTTTLAVNGAIALASAMIYRVTLLDLSLEFPNAALLMDLKPDRTLADLSDVRIEDMTDDLFDLFLATHSSGVRLVVGADRPELAELVTVPAVHHALDRLRASSDYVLVDSAATFTQHTLAAIDGADIIFVVTSAHLASLKSAMEILTVLQKLNVPKERVFVALNRTTASGLEAEQVLRFFGRRPDVTVPFTAPFDDAADGGKPLVMTSPQNAGAVVMRDLAAQIAVAAPVKR
ncbi:MAG TPA: response regulator [Candidatus Limnocylindria bacterium]|nr:response regulator [Candidatus Limnocylindria bacterium]